jgi:hypothetical protein
MVQFRWARDAKRTADVRRAARMDSTLARSWSFVVWSSVWSASLAAALLYDGRQR